MTLLEGAIKELESEGFDTRLLRENLARLTQSALQNPAARARN